MRCKPIADYIDELRNRSRRVRISNRSAKCLAFVGTKDLRWVIAQYTKRARREFKSPYSRKIRNFIKVKDVWISLLFKKGRGLKKIHARLASVP